MAFDLSLKLDFDEAGTIQPAPINIQNVQGTVGFFGSGIFGTTSYGAKLVKLFESQVVGSGFAVSEALRAILRWTQLAPGNSFPAFLDFYHMFICFC